MGKRPRRRAVSKKLKEMSETIEENKITTFANHAEKLLDKLKIEDILAEEFYISWEGKDGAEIILSAIKRKEELEWYRKVKQLLEDLIEVLPPTKEVCSSLDINHAKEIYVLLDIVSAKTKETFNRLQI